MSRPRIGSLFSGYGGLDMTRCRNIETIPTRWGGGHMCSCPYGYIHLHGPHWKWWQCPYCNLADR